MRQAPIFLISTRYQREVEGNLHQFSRSVVTVDSREDVARAYRNSAAFIAIVDARGALEQGIALTQSLSGQVEERRGGLLVLLSRNDARALPRIFEAGATHYLVSPFGGEQLDTALKFVERTIHRMRASGTEAAVAEAQELLHRSPRWRWQKGDDFVTLNADLTELLGLPASVDQLPIRDAFALLPLSEIRRVRSLLMPLVSAGVAGSVDHRLVLKDDTHRVVHHIQPVLRDHRTMVGMTATVEDLVVTEQQSRLSMHYDSLTGLANLANARARLDEVLSQEGEGASGAIATLIAVSRFDQINAVHGRHTADLLLQAVSRRLRRLIDERSNGPTIAARLGGAEFALIFTGPVLLNQAVLFSQLVAGLFDRPFIVEGQTIHLSCRIGIATSQPEMTRSDELLTIASSALASAKEQGPNSFQVYLSGRDDDPARLASLETSVRAAARAHELHLKYQPQVDMISNEVVGVEALLRYQHPVYGQLAADTLLATAERGEFAVDFGRDIVRQACAEAAGWTRLPAPMRLSVNVTAADMRDGQFVRHLLDTLNDTAYPPEFLTLEITEGGLVENLERTAEMLASLREKKIRVAIDDFGTGYSSLAYLKSLPLDYLKIDKRIAADITGETRDKIIVRGVVDMARSLGMTVIAEGVETENQLELLSRAGCNWYQGYLCSEPLSPRNLESFLTGWPPQPTKKVVNG